jgi:hypothetical protein
MYQTGGTIKETLKQIANNKYVLPAIQREFVWKPEQICKLFDSLMQGYPFGTFLLWTVNPENISKYKFYEFMRNYHERDNPHCAPLDDVPAGPIIAVLDGQQRLTALNIGLRGSMTLKLANKWWNNASAFPRKQLYLNVRKSLEADEEGVRYQFEFLTNERASNLEDDECWFKVSDIVDIEEGPAMLDWVNSRLQQSEVSGAFKILNQLYQVVHNKNLVAQYEEKSQDLEKVLNIFIRLNSGGTVLSYSDLLLSIAVSQWKKLDAREEIRALVDDLNEIGERFAFSQDVVLKAGLMLSDIGNVGFKVENFNASNMTSLEQNWPTMREALILTVQLISNFGFNGQTLRADSAILPIAYYLHQLKPGDQYISSPKWREDRDNIRNWLIGSLLKASGIWGSGLDTLLTALRETLKEHGTERFPVEQIRDVMARRGKTMAFGTEEIEELADMAYGDKRLFALMHLMFPFFRAGNIIHIDHIYPTAIFAKKILENDGVSAGNVADLKDMSQRLGNLQLLLGAENNLKRKKHPVEWLAQEFPLETNRLAYVRDHDLGELPQSMAEFPTFYVARRERLKQKIAKLLSASA